MKEEQKNIDSPMSAKEFLTQTESTGKHLLDVMEEYANYLSQYHVEKASELIAERATLLINDNIKGQLAYISESGKHFEVDKQSILSTAKEYVELNIKR